MAGEIHFHAGDYNITRSGNYHFGQYNNLDEVAITGTIHNHGPGILAISSISVINEDNCSFVFTVPPSAIDLSEGGATVFQGSVTPTSVGIYVFTVRIISDDPNTPQLDITFEGHAFDSNGTIYHIHSSNKQAFCATVLGPNRWADHIVFSEDGDKLAGLADRLDETNYYST